ncbi:MAG TPA: LEA type 2 family protein [Gemmatimonadales bacterium]|nr:LEA type 2 family protein [Gemmatimonadales bacterium]
MRRPFPVAVLVFVAACATLRGIYFREPEIHLQEVRVTSLGLAGGTVDLEFDVYNPNNYRVRSTRLFVGLDLEGTHFGDGLLDNPVELAPEYHNRIVLPVRFEWSGVGAGARALLTRQELAYELGGEVTLATPLGDKTVTLRGSGNVPLAALVP